MVRALGVQMLHARVKQAHYCVILNELEIEIKGLL
jgi:hypothetical protein